MNAGKDCPLCGNPLFVTEKMTLNWIHVLVALIPSAVIFYLLWLFLQDGYHHYGKFRVYVLFGAVGLVGLIFAKMVSKRRFRVESCTRCDYVNTQEKVNT
jgi:predicted nucleic-acid-binding Zn-ribbon protein